MIIASYLLYFVDRYHGKVIEDLSYVVLLRKRFGYIESIPGVLLPHPSSSPYPFKIDGSPYSAPPDSWQFQASMLPPIADHHQFYDPTVKIMPSMSSLEALLSKLPSVVPPSLPPQGYGSDDQHQFVAQPRPLEFTGVTAKKEVTEDDYGQGSGGGDSSRSAYSHLHLHRHHHHHHQDLNAASSMTSNGF